MMIKEKSSCCVWDDKDRIIKKGFHDINDAWAWAVNYLKRSKRVKFVTISQEVDVKKDGN